MEPIIKTRISGRDVVEIPDNLDDDFTESKPAKKPKKQQQNVPKSKEKKATYSKPLLPTAGQTKEKVDVSAWGKLGISEAVLEALSEKGFSTPTKIQVSF